VVDAEQVLNGDDPEQVAMLKLQQIGFADMLILNTTDLASHKRIAKVRAWIDSHLNRVRVVEASHCKVPLEILTWRWSFRRGSPSSGSRGNSQSSRPERYTHDHGHDFSTWSYQTQWLVIAVTENGLGSPYKRGDRNLDGFVDGLDFILWNGSKFSESLQSDNADWNGDGFVDGLDLIVWNTNKFTSIAA
jgi:hypothetical protein